MMACVRHVAPGIGAERSGFSVSGVAVVARGVPIPGVLLRFLDRASIAYAATQDGSGIPHLQWVCGWAAEPDPAHLAFFLAEPFPARLQRDVAACPRIALTIENIGPHETYQFKGDYAGSRPPGPAERVAFEGCRTRFVRAVREIETRFDFSEEPLARSMGEPASVVVLRVDEIFLQTPGPGAGRRLVPPEAR
jgi:hypothetical protein